jgi:peptide/nickel transport system permease protein
MLRWSTLSLNAKIGLVGAIFFVLFAYLGPLFSPHDPNEILGTTWEPPSDRMLLGADSLGRDLLTRLMYGTRLSIELAGAATIISFLLGVTLGFTAAVLRGWFDQIISRVVDLLMSIPTLIFALVLLSMMPRTGLILVLVTAVLDSTRPFRLSRAVALDIAVQDFVEAARLRGERTRWIVTREILPNALTPLVAEFGLRFAFIMLFLSSLSFLGLGIQPPEQDLGRMIRDNREGIVYGISAALWPGAIIALLALSVNLVVDAILNRTTSLKGGRGG